MRLKDLKKDLRKRMGLFRWTLLQIRFFFDFEHQREIRRDNKELKRLQKNYD